MENINFSIGSVGIYFILTQGLKDSEELNFKPSLRYWLADLKKRSIAELF
jgi:hypothetical protein